MTPETPHTEDSSSPVAPVQDVLAALADPVRLEMVRRLVDADGPTACSALYDDVSKSTASHHFKTLREAGLTRRLVIGGQVHQELRLGEVDSCYPGLLRSIVDAAARGDDRR
jgi:DNA-binding transcriptional ArsR family regulator